MRIILPAFILIACFSTLFAQLPDEGILSTRLKNQIEKSPQDFHHISILLTNRVNIKTLDRSFYNNKATIQHRTTEVINQLKTKASQTQPAIINRLNNDPDVEPGSIVSFWLTNVLFAKVRKELIYELSRMPEIEWIDLNVPSQLDEFVEEDCALPPLPGEAEPGLKAINAPALWEMGYTGYGTIAMGADTGIDPTHPAISCNFRGRFAPPEQVWFNSGNPANTELFNCGDHGTHTLGTMVGLDRTVDDTIGVAFNAQWIGAPNLCGNGTEGNIATFQWAINPDNDETTISDMPGVINNSWWDPQVANGEDCMSAYVDVFSALEAAGIAIVFSAGNSGPGASTITTPKNINTDLVNVFSVGALDGNNSTFPIAGFSSRGPSTCTSSDESLLIKPEVSAPGSNVRSCELEGTYGLKSGTSMAAPHACGAVLLLKEAFPELTGTELKLALYFTCTDLGEPGEDNTFGMGIIDLEKAFNYLIDQGHTPVSPHVDNDVILVEVDAQRLNCNSSLEFDVRVENAGLLDLTALDIHYTLTDNNGIVLEEVLNWTGNLPSKEREIFTFSLTDTPEGVYTLEVTLINPNGVADEHNTNNTKSDQVLVSAVPPLAIQTLGDSPPCTSSNAVLFVDYEGEATINWYLTEDDETPIATGAYFLVPGLTGDFTFYVDAQVVEYTGKTDLDINNSSIDGEQGQGIIFDAFAPFTLKSVKIYAETPGVRLVTLANEDGGSIKQKVVQIQEAGEQRVDLNFDIPIGENMKLGISAGAPFFYSTDASYPYIIGNVISIKHSSDFVEPLTNYYFFYDWEIEHDYVCERASFELNFQGGTTAPEANFNAPETIELLNNEVSFENVSQDAQSYFWDFGDGTTSTAENPVHSYTSIGTYNIILIVEGSDNCSDAIIKTIEVIESTTSISNDHEGFKISVYPNPAKDQLMLRLDGPQSEPFDFYLTDVFGRKVDIWKDYTTNQNQTISLSNYASGIYYLVFQLKENKLVKKIIIL